MGPNSAALDASMNASLQSMMPLEVILASTPKDNFEDTFQMSELYYSISSLSEPCSRWESDMSESSHNESPPMLPSVSEHSLDSNSSHSRNQDTRPCKPCRRTSGRQASSSDELLYDDNNQSHQSRESTSRMPTRPSRRPTAEHSRRSSIMHETHDADEISVRQQAPIRPCRRATAEHSLLVFEPDEEANELVPEAPRDIKRSPPHCGGKRVADVVKNVSKVVGDKAREVSDKTTRVIHGA